MVIPRLGTVFDLSVWCFIFYYIIGTIVPYTIILLEYLPNLLSVKCTKTLGKTSKNPTFETACCIVSDCVSASLNHLPTARAPQAFDRIISMWHDKEMVSCGDPEWDLEAGFAVESGTWSAGHTDIYGF